VLTGGTRLEDVDRLRNEVPLMNGLGAKLLPDPTTTGDFLRRFTEADIVALMDAINSVRPVWWRGRGADLVGEVVYLDADGTIVPTTGELKQGMDIFYKGIWGYAPLLITLATPGKCSTWSTGRATRPATWTPRPDACAPGTWRVCPPRSPGGAGARPGAGRQGVEVDRARVRVERRHCTGRCERPAGVPARGEGRWPRTEGVDAARTTPQLRVAAL
jgi:hypothetical protein